MKLKDTPYFSRMKIAFCSLIFCLGHVLSHAQPSNDDWANATPISIPDQGFGTGTFASEKISLKGATTELAEYFSNVLAAVALDQKSVWYSFTTATSRNVEVVLRQNDTTISPLDVGMTIYRADGQYPDPQNETHYLPSLSQMGSVSGQCIPKATYYIQIGARQRVEDSIWVEVKLANTTNALGDRYDQPANGKARWTFANCHTLQNTLERQPFFLPEIDKSGYIKVTTKELFDRVQITMSGFGVVWMLFQDSVPQDTANWKPLMVYNWFDTNGVYNKVHTCYDVFKPNSTYYIKVLGKENARFHFNPFVYSGSGFSPGGNPTDKVIDWKTISKDTDMQLQWNISCDNEGADNVCPSRKDLLIDSTYIFRSSEDVDTVIFTQQAGFWSTFKLTKNTTFQYFGLNALQKAHLFRGKAKDNACDLSQTIPLQSNSKCLKPGEYTLLVLSPIGNIHEEGDNSWIGSNVHFRVRFFPVEHENLDKPHLFGSMAQANNLGSINSDARVRIPDDYLNNSKTIVLGKDTLSGAFSFHRFSLTEKSHLAVSVANHSSSNRVATWLYAGHSPLTMEMLDYLYRVPLFTQKMYPKGDYTLVFYRYENTPCNPINGQKTYDHLHTKSFISPPGEPEPCVNPHQWTKNAQRINNLEHLRHRHQAGRGQPLGQYRFTRVCTEVTGNLGNPHFYNYPKYRKKIQGLTYYVFKLDTVKKLNIQFNVHFQVLKGNIIEDSTTLFDEKNVLLEWGLGAHEFCPVKPGYYTLIAAANSPFIDGTISVFPDGYSTHNHAKLAQDVGFLHSKTTTVTATGEIGCATTYQAKDPVVSNNNWHTFRAAGPCRVEFDRTSQFALFLANNGHDATFNEVKQLGLVDSILDSNHLQYAQLLWQSDKNYLDILTDDTLRFYLLQYNRPGFYAKYSQTIRYIPDSLATEQGDYCHNANAVDMGPNQSKRVETYSSIHTLGEGYDEQEGRNLWLQNLDQYKTSWCKIKVNGAAGQKLTLSPVVNNSVVITAFRIYYGSCNALTPGSIVRYAGSSITLDCISDGDYYIQLFHQKRSKGYVTFQVETTPSFGVCRNMDLQAVLANFKAIGGCNDDPVQFTNYSTSGSSMAYYWDFGDGQTDSTKHPSHRYVSSSSLDTYKVQLVAINTENGRTDTIVRKVAAGQLQFSAGNDTLVCERSYTTHPFVPYKQAQYAWVLPNIFGPPTHIHSYDKHASLFAQQDTNEVILRLTIGNCTDYDTVMVRSLANYRMQNQFAPTICPDDSMLYFKPPVGEPLDWTWNGKPAPDSHWVKEAGEYAISLHLAHCSDQRTIYLSKSEKPASIDTVPEACVGNIMQFNFQDQWWFNSTQNDQGLNRILFTGEREYPIMWSTRIGTCPPIHDTVYVDDEIAIPRLLRDTVICSGQAVRLVTGDTATNFAWNTGDSTREIVVNRPGLYLVQMYKGPCYSADTVAINASEMPKVAIRDTSLCLEDQTIIPWNVSGEGAINWSTGDTTQQILVDTPGLYWVELVRNRCAASDTATVTSICPPTLFIPNAFTPNADEHNPTFKAKGTKIQSFEMTIYSRNGQVVFYSDKLEEGWDGTLRGEPATVGAYLYTVRYQNENGWHESNGVVHLVR